MDNTLIDTNLPGARILKTKNVKNKNSLVNHGFIDDAPLEVTENIRAYLDEVFGSLMHRLSEEIDPKVFLFIGSTVDCILRYNNIHFREVTVFEVKEEFNMPEPLWFDLDSVMGVLDKLNIFLNFEWYKTYISINTDVPVVWQNGNVPIERFNTSEQDSQIAPMEIAKIKCVVACDHLAQHVIHRYHIDGPQLSNCDIHDSWTRHGTTLHSFLDLTIITNNTLNSPLPNDRYDHRGYGVLSSFMN